MKRDQEIEIKLKVTNPRQLKRAIKGLGFKQRSHRAHERNTLFDFEGGPLRKAGCALRLRIAGGGALLTFKGASRNSEKYKIRREVETAVGDPQRLSTILKALGLRPVLSYEKYRTLYSSERDSKHATLSWDETAVGTYLELEGPRRWIDRVARQLGFRREEYLTTTYVALLAKSGSVGESRS
jgi:adenylate cyclase, class 2